jgi:hypothetical protein
MMTLLQIANDAEVTVSGMDAMLKFASKIGFRLLIDLGTIFILIRFIYYPLYKQSEFFFMFAIFNLIIFMISFLLNKVDLSMGAAFGLFAVFSMLRYRTESISIKDMTYLFLCIAIGLLTAVTKIKGAVDMYEYIFLIGLNSAVLILTWFLETNHFVKKEMSKFITYENIELIQSHRHGELLEDLKMRTGINVHRFVVQRINFLKDSAIIKIYYYE